MTPDEAEAWAHGDPSVCARHEARVWRLIWVYVRWTLPKARAWTHPTDQDANDITQQARMKILKSNYQCARGPLRPWVYRLSEQASVEYFRRLTRWGDPSPLEDIKVELAVASAELDEEVGSEPSDELAAFIAAVEEIVDDTTGGRRQALDVWRTGGDYHAIAANAGITPGAAATRLSRALTHLRACLEERGYFSIPRGEGTPVGATLVALYDDLKIIYLPAGGTSD
jgi:DNA-directed RNA polymerase specialized sigma24 family protein